MKTYPLFNYAPCKLSKLKFRKVLILTQKNEATCYFGTPVIFTIWTWSNTHKTSKSNHFGEDNEMFKNVGTALGYGLDDRGSRVRFPAGDGNSSLHHRVQNGSGPTQPPIQRAPWALSLGVKRPGREAYHSSPCVVEDKKAWSYISTPPYVFMVW